MDSNVISLLREKFNEQFNDSNASQDVMEKLFSVYLRGAATAFKITADDTMSKSAVTLTAVIAMISRSQEKPN